MSLAPTSSSPTDALPFLADLIGYLAEWEAAHAAEIQKTFLFVHPQTHYLWYAVLGTSLIYDLETTLPDELAEFSLRVRRSPRFPGVDFDGRFILGDQGWQIEGMSRGMDEVRRDG